MQVASENEGDAGASRKEVERRVGVTPLNSCFKCPPGFGASRVCTEREDTVCHACIEGTYSQDTSEILDCFLCSGCGDGLFELHACNPFRDTICDSCHSKNHTHTPDYFRKCSREKEPTPGAEEQKESMSSLHESLKVLGNFKFLLLFALLAMVTLVVFRMKSIFSHHPLHRNKVSKGIGAYGRLEEEGKERSAILEVEMEDLAKEREPLQHTEDEG
ncbi:unnamed protein product [Darwinula stevensoni]|uniref:TNFR-Cys domain-containing protein n=1 Tax=Darwinula stevensoni TaxID=69355 RepID=A0A7R9ACU0_9CRUS|nr:unnamed protein product [Darwinula stevensoni]CAG0900405.1 unnamed protein product [Darwinula stevensoni]